MENKIKPSFESYYFSHKLAKKKQFRIPCKKIEIIALKNNSLNFFLKQKSYLTL
jgi:hypothetical protein